MSLSFSDWPIFSTVRIITHRATGGGTGTGFYVNFAKSELGEVPCLVTNKHVIKDGESFVIYIKANAIDEQDETINGMFEITFPGSGNLWILHPDPEVDLAALPMTMFFNGCRRQGLKPIYAPFDSSMTASDTDYKNLTAIENILMVGYPIGLWDSVHNNPIARRGITATPVYNDFQGKKEFLIDCACFPGSSGSPVMLFDVGGYTEKNGASMVGASRLMLLGIMYKGPQLTASGSIEVVDVPTDAVVVSKTDLFINLGFCIKATELSFFEDHFRKVVASEIAAQATQILQNPGT